VDFFDEAMWAFVGAFLALRAITFAAAAAAIAALRSRGCNRRAGSTPTGALTVTTTIGTTPPKNSFASQVCELWLGLSWQGDCCVQALDRH
jgi:hypothetical protein